MKRKIDYKPKYSLSVKYLQMIMTKREYNALLKKYVAKKIEHWGTYKK